MFHLSKKTEYGLQALTYLSNLEDSRWANVTEIARSAMIPKELLAKILSELVKAGLALSFSGPTGGFRAAKDPKNISLAEILTALENKTGLIACDTGDGACKQRQHCTIRKPMTHVNKKVKQILEETMLADFLAS